MQNDTKSVFSIVTSEHDGDSNHHVMTASRLTTTSGNNISTRHDWSETGSSGLLALAYKACSAMMSGLLLFCLSNTKLHNELLALVYNACSAMMSRVLLFCLVAYVKNKITCWAASTCVQMHAVP